MSSWICPTCSKSFMRKGDLTRHKFLHSGYKPHICLDCGKSFSQFSGLKTHRNTHTKVKPFKCGIHSCTAAFGDPSSCARHRKETHSHIDGYHCPYPGCYSSIKRRSAFTAHLKKHGILDPKADNIDVAAFPPSSPTIKAAQGFFSILDFGQLDDFYPNHTTTNMPNTYHESQPAVFSYDLSSSYHTMQPDNSKEHPAQCFNSPPQFSPSYINSQDQLFTLDSRSSSYSPPSLTFSLSPSPAPSLDAGFSQSPLNHTVPQVRNFGRVTNPPLGLVSPLAQTSPLLLEHPYATTQIEKTQGWVFDYLLY